MTNFSWLDLQLVHLGIKGGGKFDERDIEKSELKKLGVGRILDQLGSLVERKLIEMNKDGSFLVTSQARHVFWDETIPLWIRIFRILEIKSQTMEDISTILMAPQDDVFKKLEELRKKHLVLMSPMRNQKGILKMYEVLPEGIEQVQKAISEGSSIIPSTSHSEIGLVIDEITKEIKNFSEIPTKKKSDLLAKLEKIRELVEKNSI